MPSRRMVMAAKRSVAKMILFNPLKALLAMVSDGASGMIISSGIPGGTWGVCSLD